ncbi:MAG: CDP-diacylglycerol--serine O-phosphatidyltransferase [Muribaculaceae bacterium]|nr:CDP-diacylglycerol--serine O-phosphatidyltransferase [Muribaculaceae bacterium]MDE6332433.1 CDP-diacylglycerol--serine O-phosphatidyltransferase [Muribaculaceae bacterium]
MSIKSIIPNSVTCLNLLSGCAAIIFAWHGGDEFAGLSGLTWACIMIGAAAMFDFCDGATARLLKAYSEIGKELDSLSDLVSFGVAPAMLMINVMQLHSDSPLAYGALIVPLCGALRLAKFNVDESQTSEFSGLPIPANALFLIGLYGWINRYGYPGTIAVLLITAMISLTMVCNLRMFSLKFHNFGFAENFRRYVIIFAAIAFIIGFGAAGLAWTVVLYLLLSLADSRRKKQ